MTVYWMKGWKLKLLKGCRMENRLTRKGQLILCNKPSIPLVFFKIKT